MGRHKKFTLEELTSAQRFEICELYKGAKDPAEQIGICADLYNVTKATVMTVLTEAGLELPEKKTKPEAIAEPLVDTPRPEPAPVRMQNGTKARDVLARAEIVLALVQPHDTTAIVQKLADLAADLVREDAVALIYGGVTV
jgi:hypothetical protein